MTYTKIPYSVVDVKNIDFSSGKKSVKKLFPKVVSMIDKLTKNNIIHKNKASNLKSKLNKHFNVVTKK